MDKISKYSGYSGKKLKNNAKTVRKTIEYINENMKIKDSEYNIRKKIIIQKKQLKISFTNYATLNLSERSFIDDKALYMNLSSKKDITLFKGAKVQKIIIKEIKDNFRFYIIKTSVGSIKVKFERE